MSDSEHRRGFRSRSTGRLDRRAARTRRALHEALITLILRKGYDALTVQDLIDQADVGRATFYAHYSSREDLLRSGFERLAGELRSARRSAAGASGHASPLAFSLAMFRHAGEYRQVFRALIGDRGGTVVLHEMRRVLTEVVAEELGPLESDQAMSGELCVEFVVGAFLAVLTWWLQPACKLSAEAADAMFRRLVVDGLGPLLSAESRRAAAAPGPRPGTAKGRR